MGRVVGEERPDARLPSKGHLVPLVNSPKVPKHPRIRLGTTLGRAGSAPACSSPPENLPSPACRPESFQNNPLKRNLFLFAHETLREKCHRQRGRLHTPPRVTTPGRRSR